MKKPVTISELRSNIYRMIDSIIDTGEPLMLERNGVILRIVADLLPASKLERLKARDCIVGDPKSLVDVSWGYEPDKLV